MAWIDDKRYNDQAMSVLDWIKRRPGGDRPPRITVCWMDTGVSLVRWAPRSGSKRVCHQVIEMASADCSTGAYLSALRSLSDRRGCGGHDVRWILVNETLPVSGDPGGTGDGRVARVPPAWMLACWEGLDVQAFPERVYSGLACLDEEFRRRPQYTEAGTGVCLSIGQRLVFLACAREAAFHRVSRPDFLDGLSAASSGRFTEWIQQTGMLYKGRTGMELRRVFVPDNASVGGSPLADWNIGLIRELRPPAWLAGGADPVNISLLYLHASALGIQTPRTATLAIPEISGRVAHYRHESLLRLTACLLLGGWMLLLLGACQSRPDIPESAAEQAGAWRAELKRWREASRQWEDRTAVGHAQSSPYRIVGTIARSVPLEVGLRHIHLDNTVTVPGGGASFELEGEYSGSEATVVFRDWMHHLREQGALSTVENLRFKPDGEALDFLLKGMVPDGGAR